VVLFGGNTTSCRLRGNDLDRRGPGAGELIEARKRAAKLAKCAPAWRKAGLSRAGRVIKFCESLPVTKGIRAGKKMKLLPRQIEFIREVYDAKACTRIGIDSAPSKFCRAMARALYESADGRKGHSLAGRSGFTTSWRKCRTLNCSTISKPPWASAIARSASLFSRDNL
jgi:hypothetical protein